MKILTALMTAVAVGISLPVHAADTTAGADFVALDVCDAMGVLGLTISSNDTCLSISGEVEYEFELEIDGATGDLDTTSEVDWELVFEAMTQADGGTATALIAFSPEDPADPNSALEITEAYVSFGDTTVLTAGYTGSIFEVARNQLIFERLRVHNIGESHVIQLVSVMDNGVSFGIGAEDLDDDGALGAFVGYRQGGLTANLGGFVYNLYDVMDLGASAEWNIYGDVRARYDPWELFAAFVVDHEGFEALSSAGVDVGEVFLKAAAGIEYDEPTDVWTHALGLGFEVGIFDFEARFFTEAWADLAVELELVAELTDDLELEFVAEFEDVRTDSDAEATLTLTYALAENWEAEAWVGLEYQAVASTTIYGAGGGLTYEPGGNFDASVNLEGWSNGDMIVGFSAAKAF